MGDRALASVLITDIAGSTERAAKSGDRRWRQVLERHDELARETATAHGGEWLKSTGDGMVAIFNRPADAIHAGVSFIAAARQRLDVDVRAGIHIGECERRADDVAGIAVLVAVRIAALAPAGQLLISRTVRDLVAGGEVRSASAGSHTLKGVPGRWQLYTVADAARSTVPAPRRAGVSVVCVDDHPLWRQTLRTVVEQGGVGRVVAEANDGPEAVATVVQHRPDVVVMDMQLPTMSGIAATRAVLDRAPQTRVLVLSSNDDPGTVRQAVRAGVSGYLLKTAEAEEIRAAIRRVAAGELVFPAALSSIVLRTLRGEDDAAGPVPGPAPLTEREQEVLDLMAEGLSNQAIAKRLFLSAKTVETHVSAVFDKLALEPTHDVNRRVRAVVSYLRTATGPGKP